MTLRIAVGIVLRESEGGLQVLVARRLGSATHSAGLREFPGGKVEPGESATQAVEREILEETGLQVLAGPPYPPISWRYPEREIELLAFDCQVLGGEARAIESEEIAWIAPRELDASEFPRANASLIEAIQSRHAP